MITDVCDDTGIQITVPSAMASDLTRGANNLILNCDSHDNYDAATGGENADGIDAKLDIGPGNIFRGCRSWNNSDDGYDLFGVTQVVTIDNCWAMLNGHLATERRARGRRQRLQAGRQPRARGPRGHELFLDDQRHLRLHAEQQHRAAEDHRQRRQWQQGQRRSAA